MRVFSLARGVPICVKQSKLYSRSPIYVGYRSCSTDRRGIRQIFVDPCDDPESAAEGAHLGSFIYDELKSNRYQTVKPDIQCFTGYTDAMVSGSAEEKQKILNAWNRGTQLAMAQNLARKWMEMPANLLSPVAFANQAVDLLDGLNTPSGAKLITHIRNQDWCREHRLRGLLSVGAGSHRQSVFLEIIYEGNPAQSGKHVALVGKGVTFDSGGISLKPSAGMEDMRADMGGAAVVVATVFGLASLKVPINVRAYIPLCENMPGGRAMRPGDVIRMASGLTVQVDNTDAEGRLILADALYMASNHPDLLDPPCLIIDLATLTGAISVALSDLFTGVFSNKLALRLSVTDMWSRQIARRQTTTEDSISSPETEEEEEEDGDEEIELVDSEPVLGKDINFKSKLLRDQSIFECLRDSGWIRGDQLWRMPLLHKNVLHDNCHLADLVNVTSGSLARSGGSGSAASFLSSFVHPGTPWMHLDIAGVMKSTVSDSILRKGMTGRPTRTLIQFLDHLSRFYP